MLKFTMAYVFPLGIGGQFGTDNGFKPSSHALLQHVSEPSVEQQAENVVLVVGGVDCASEHVRSPPEVTFKLAECQ